MTIEDSTIKSAYELEGMSPSEIAEDRGLNEIAVKAKLMQVSTRYRKDCKQEPEGECRLNFNENQQEDFLRVIHETALSAETPDGAVDYRTRLAAAIYGRDDGKGRKDIKPLANMSGNIFQLNEILIGVKERTRAIKEAVEV